MIQQIRNHFVTKWIAIGIIPSFLLPLSSYASVSKVKAPKEIQKSVFGTIRSAGHNQFPKSIQEGIRSSSGSPESFHTETISSVGGPSDGNYGGAAASGEFVDLSTGDFSYSIPLLDVGGYPITISYDANVTMDQQASMLGLGWSMGTGSINRIVRGIPDDFNGDPITTTMNLRPQLSITNNFALNGEFIGVDVLGDFDASGGGGIDVAYTFSNYTGNESSIGGSGSFGIGKDLTNAGPSAFLSGGLNSSSRSGLSTNIGASLALGEQGQFASSLGLNRNSLHGSSLNTSFGYTARSSVGKLGLSLNGTFSLGMQSYTPTASFEFTNKSWTFDIAAGYELPLSAIHGGYTRTKSTVCLKERIKTQPAYGYMNLQNGYASNAIQDFNINLGEVHEAVSGVNTPIPTNDYFIVSGAGMFRAIRNDAGYVKNPTAKSDGDALAIGGDFAAGYIPPALVTFEIGVNVNYNWNNTTSGNWVDNNPLSGGPMPEFAYKNYLPIGTDVEKGEYEHFSLQKVNNRGSSSVDRYVGMREEKPLRQEIDRVSGEIIGKSSMTSDNGDPLYYPSSDSYYQVERRNQNEVLINESNRELRLSDKDAMRSYSINSFTYENGDYLGASDVERSNVKYPDHHIGQLTVIGTGGFKEVYGIPVMNETDQVSFNISEINNYVPADGAVDPVVGTDGLVSYKGGLDNSLNNLRGDNNFYLKNHVPSHATSYLLTEQLSDNYVDLTNNGPTPDDYGTYTKINYGFIGQNQWRFPFEAEKATYNEGFKSSVLDDMASYAYGKRDDWLIHSIETKNFIAEFTYSPRHDAYSVGDEDGISLGDPSQKLDEIRLYSRQGKEKGEKPLKTVHFVYDYELCNGTPDNDLGQGKLTLKSVYFTGQDSPEGQLHKYKFSYANNPDYDPSQVDRWGNYQAGNTIDHAALSSLDNGEYPYTIQDKTIADNNAQSWKLSSIDLPTGSRIEIYYEADQYEFIQNVEATRMFKIDGFYASDESPYYDKPEFEDFSEVIFDPDNKEQEYFYMLVNLDGTISGTESDALSVFENHYLPEKQGDDRYLYFNTLLNLAPHNDGIVDPDVYEYVQGYAELVDGGWYLLETTLGSGIWNRAVYQVKPADLDEGKPTKGVTHPVSRKTFQMIKDGLPLVLYPEDNLDAIFAKDGLINCDGVDLEDGEAEPDLSDDSKNHKKNMKSIRSIYHMMRNTGFASRAVVNLDGNPLTSDSKCWVRMRLGPNAKIGGGHRVSEIRMYDNWNENVPSENGSVYGLIYEYSQPDSDISSGVATYEPNGSGGDEIALRRPNFFTHNQRAMPSEKYYTEFPLNEEVFASASIGYSNVRVRSISYDGLVSMVPGYTDHQFFTAKDYPVRMSNTNIMEGKELRPPGAWGLIGVSKRRFGVSYGTNIVTNDMHGKFRAKNVYSQNGSIIYKMQHTYLETEEGHLANIVPTIFSDGSAQGRMIGQHSDFLTFMNKSESNFSSVALKVQADVIAPAPTPSAYPSASTFENTIYTSLTSKITYQSGIIDRVLVEDNGRDKSTTNLFYDAKSGAAIVTEVIPEKGADIRKMYDYSYPAYWKYEELGLDSDNARIQRLNITGTDAVIDPAEEVYFNVGDRLSVFEMQVVPFPEIINFKGDYWVIENESTGDLFLADKWGALFVPVPATNYRFKIVDPGNKNSTGAAMANVSSLKAPDGASPYAIGYPHERVISISGIELFEGADIGGTCVNPGDILNPYTHNLKGQWKLKHTYSFDGKRDYSSNNSRVDGCLTTYQPFWQNQGGTWMAINDPERTGYTLSDPYQDWIQNGEATTHDQFGFGLESKNPLGIYTSAGVGYNHSYSTYNAVNSRYQEVVFDGFEDYETNGIIDPSGDFVTFPCQERHLQGSSVNFSDLEAHTGKYSYLVIGPNDGYFNASIWNGIPAVTGTRTAPFVLAPSEELKGFKLINDEEDNRYVLSVWAKENNPTNPINYDAAGVTINIDGGFITPSEINRSNIIDGWQRLEIIFEVDPATLDGSSVEVQLLATNTFGVFYDDLRIHPFDSEMKSQVIDPVKQRISATLDSRNFATIYQYDENGTLVRIIQETERGKQTVKENRSGIVLND